MAETTAPGYWHTQKAPLGLMLYRYGIAIGIIAFGWVVGSTVGMFFAGWGLLYALHAAAFHHLTGVDQGEVLAIRFGPIPLLRRTVRYADIIKVESGRTLFLFQVWSIHFSIWSGWTWKLWGRGCVVVHLKMGALTIGTDDAENVVRFLEGKIGHPIKKFEFTGTVVPSKGIFTQEIVVPGRNDLFITPEDWPKQLAPGTLSIEVTELPLGFEEIGHGNGLKKFDKGKFQAELIIPQRKIAGNPLQPDADHPTRGFGLAWRAELQAIATSQTKACWMLRIIHSDSPSQIDLVAHDDLRSRLNLADGMAVKVTVWEAETKWMPMTPDEFMNEKCRAARGVLENFGADKAMGYLIGEKFLDFLEVAEKDWQWRQAIPAFVAEINALIEPLQLAEFLNTPRRLGALGHVASEEGHRMLREGQEESSRLREDARNLMLLEWAKELLLEA